MFTGMITEEIGEV